MNKIKEQTELAVLIENTPADVYEGLTAEQIRSAFSPEQAGIRPEKPSRLKESTLEEQQLRTSYGI